MSRLARSWRPAAASDPCDHRSDHCSGTSEGGFTLIETVVALALIGVIMSALVTFFIGGLSATDGFRRRQVAATLGDQAVERVRSVAPDVAVLGRDQSSESALWSNRVALLGFDPTDAVETYDAGAASGTGATAATPTVAVMQTYNGDPYYVYYLVGKCYQPRGGGSCVSTSSASTDVLNYRVWVAVHFPKSGTVCTTTSCRYVTTTLINPQADPAAQPVFNNSVTTP